eukprot:c43179_g1_i1 orf=1-198(-)
MAEAFGDTSAMHDGCDGDQIDDVVRFRINLSKPNAEEMRVPSAHREEHVQEAEHIPVTPLDEIALL